MTDFETKITDDNAVVSGDQAISDDQTVAVQPEPVFEHPTQEIDEEIADNAVQSESVKANTDSAAEHNKMRIVAKALRNIERDITNLVRLLESEAGPASAETARAMSSIGRIAASANGDLNGSFQPSNEGRVVEGVFDGQNMVGSDGKIYTVPANYASKSKLVEGDMLKLTITPRGSFIYKQIGPIDRVRVMATLGFDPMIGEFYAADETRRWNILKASVTYYRGDAGDEVVLLVPKNAPSKWAAVENIIKNSPNEGNVQTYQTQPVSPEQQPAEQQPEQSQPKQPYSPAYPTE